MTALHITASSKKTPEHSFSSAKVRLRPSMIKASSSTSPPMRWFLIANRRLLSSSEVSVCDSVLTKTRFIDSEIKRQERPILMAVS